MTRSLVCTTALVLFLPATAGLAQVTPEEVWQSWQDATAASGQQLTVGNTSKSGDTLTVTGVSVSLANPDGGTFVADLGDLAFKDNGDGTVGVTMADSYPMTLTFPPEEDAPGSIRLTVSQPGLEITAGGSATETTYDFKAPEVKLTLDEVKDQSGAVIDTKGDLSFSNITASNKVGKNGEATTVDTSFASDGMTLNLSGSDTDGPGKGVVTLELSTISGSTKGNLLGAAMMENMAEALNAGFYTDSSFSFGQLTFSADVTDEMGQTKIGAGATGGEIVLAVDKARVNYGTSIKGVNVSASGGQIPFPEVTSSFGEFTFNVLIPSSKSDAPQDFAFLTKLVDYTVSDEVWGLFDPAGTLSREPATFILDTKGTGRWLADIMDPAYQGGGMEPPGELNTLDLTQFVVKAAGAEVGAAGALTFDNTDLATFGGVPRPDGSINVTIKGVNKLIDNLIAMGMLPDDQAMGFRMMLGMFTRPGAGPDEVTSLIEFKDGGLFANGQQLQ